MPEQEQKWITEARRLAEEGLSQRQIAERVKRSQSAVQRVLGRVEMPAELLEGASREAIDQATKPVGKTPGGARYFASGRFDGLPRYQERVAELAGNMPEVNARRQAAREFAGSAR